MRLPESENGAKCSQPSCTAKLSTAAGVCGGLRVGGHFAGPVATPLSGWILFLALAAPGPGFLLVAVIFLVVLVSASTVA
jgi:hypothetical protein